MNLHEFQAKRLLRQVGIPVPRGDLISAPEDIPTLYVALGQPASVLLKAQVHSGGRGKAGGIVRVDHPAEARREAERLLGSRLVTAQSGPDGLPVDGLLMETAVEIERECYLSLLVDRRRACVVLIVSAEGGMEIETLAQVQPTAVVTLPIHPATGMMPYHVRRVAQVLGLGVTDARAMATWLQQLYTLFQDVDAQLLEINPWVRTRQGEWLALDAKLVLEDAAAFRQAERFAERDPRQQLAVEEEARIHDLNFIRLQGNIGCMVNGAGLAMATMDLIQLHGGRPANFLDVGGGTTVERVAAAFKLILADPSVRAILVNIFGGIVRCDLIAEGILAALREVQVQVPVIVRLEGTRAAEGRAVLANHGVGIRAAEDLDRAARFAVEAAA